MAPNHKSLTLQQAMIPQWLTPDKEHDDEDDRKAPEGNGHRLEGKVLHTVQLLQGTTQKHDKKP